MRLICIVRLYISCVLCACTYMTEHTNTYSPHVCMRIMIYVYAHMFPMMRDSHTSTHTDIHTHTYTRARAHTHTLPVPCKEVTYIHICIHMYPQKKSFLGFFFPKQDVILTFTRVHIHKRNSHRFARSCVLSSSFCCTLLVGCPRART